MEGQAAAAEESSERKNADNASMLLTWGRGGAGGEAGSASGLPVLAKVCACKRGVQACSNGHREGHCTARGNPDAAERRRPLKKQYAAESSARAARPHSTAPSAPARRLACCREQVKVAVKISSWLLSVHTLELFAVFVGLRGVWRGMERGQRR